jgi:hypothetical protein
MKNLSYSKFVALICCHYDQEKLTYLNYLKSFVNKLGTFKKKTSHLPYSISIIVDF